MAGNQWEVVGKNKKPKTKPISKQESKENLKEKAVKEVASGAIRESETIYAAFLEKEAKREEQKNKLKEKEAAAAKASNNNPQKKKKATEKKPSATKTTLEDACASITDEEIKNHLAKLEALFPKLPVVWLKDLASFFNVKLDVVQEDFTFSNKTQGYPSCLLSKKVYQQVPKLLNRCTPEMLKMFNEFCLQNMVQDILKGLNTVGYRLMLQILAQEKPQIILLSIPKCSEFCHTHQNRQNVCLSVLWAAGQVANKNLEAGSRVWMDLMFPLIGTKNCTVFVVDFLEKLVDSAQKTNVSLFGAQDLFPILDFVYSKDLVKSVQKRLISIYPAIKSLSHGPTPETTLHNFFPSYLRRLESNCSPALKEEVLNSLTYCLEKDVRCFGLWRQIYSELKPHSKVLLSHLNSLPESSLKLLNARSLRDTILDFQRKDGKDSPLLMELQLKTSSSSTSWLRWSILMFVFILGTTALIFSLLAHPESSRWIAAAKKNAYYYGGELRRISHPMFDATMSHLSATGAALWEGTAVAREYVAQNGPVVLAEVEKQFVTQGAWLWSEIRVFSTFVSKAFFAFGTQFLSSAESFALWVENSPQIMTALTAVKEFVYNLQLNAVHLVEQAKQYIS